MKKIIRIAAAIIAAVMCMTIPAFAQETPVETVTYADAIIAYETAFGNPELLPANAEEWAKLEGCQYEGTWFDARWNCGRYQETIGIETAAKMLMAISGKEAFPRQLFNDEPTATPYWYSVTRYGYVNPDMGETYGNAQYRLITKAEFNDLLNWAVSVEFTTMPVPEYTTPYGVKVESDGFKTTAEAEAQKLIAIKVLLTIPEELLKQFVADGFKIVVMDTDAYNSTYYAQFGTKTNGFFDSSLKKIVVHNPTALPHEFGHYLDYKHPSTKLSGLYRTEATALSKFAGNYCKTNKSEFMATAFDQYLSRPAFLKKNCSGIYTYIDDLMLKYYTPTADAA